MDYRWIYIVGAFDKLFSKKDNTICQVEKTLPDPELAGLELWDFLQPGLLEVASCNPHVEGECFRLSVDVFKFKLKPNTTSKLPKVYRTLVRVESAELHAELRRLGIQLPSRKHRQWPVCSLLYIGNMSPYQHMYTTDRILQCTTDHFRIFQRI